MNQRLWLFTKRLKALDWAVLGLFGLATLSLSWSVYPHVALREWRTLILEPALFYLMVRTTIRTRVEVMRLADTFLLAATLAAAIGLIMYLAGQGVVVAEGGTRRLAGVYGSPNNVGLMMERAIPFALAYLLVSTSLPRRILAGLAGVVMLLAVALSQSVGAILLGVPVAVALVLLLWHTRRALYVIAAGAVAALGLAIPLSQHPRFSALLDPTSGTSFFRIKLWQSAWHMLQTRPLRGLGMDQFLYYYRGRFILPEAWQEPSLSHPHNIVLDFWTRLGLGGLVLLAGTQVAFWRALWRLREPLRAHSELQAVGLGAMGSMAGLLAHGLIDNSVFVLDLSYVFILLLALPSLLDAAQD